VEEAKSQRAPTGAQAAPLTPELIAQATQRLTTSIGPIAKVIAKRAAAQAASRHHFYSLLAENITDRAERSRFLRDVGAG